MDLLCALSVWTLSADSTNAQDVSRYFVRLILSNADVPLPRELINIMDLYYNFNHNLNFRGTASRFVAYGITEAGGTPQIFLPCRGVESRFGCNTFMQAIANPENPTEPLNGANIRVIPTKTILDDRWSNDISFMVKNVRTSAGDKAACEKFDEAFDPNEPW